MTEEDYPWDHPYPTAEERDVENIYPSDTDTKDSWKWGEWLHCDDVMDKDFQEKLKDLGDVNTILLMMLHQENMVIMSFLPRKS